MTSKARRVVLWGGLFSVAVVVLGAAWGPGRAWVDGGVVRTEQRWAAAELLRPEAHWLSLGEAWSRSQGPQSAPPTQARLVSQDGAPLWLVNDAAGRSLAISALDGRAHDVAADEALRIANQWVQAHTVQAQPLRHLGLVPINSATPPAITGTGPWHRIAVGSAGRELWVSRLNGDVVRDSTPLQRWLTPWAGLTALTSAHTPLRAAPTAKQPLPAQALAWSPAAADDDGERQVVELQWRRLGDRAVLRGVTRAGERMALATPGTVTAFDDGAVSAAAAAAAHDVGPVPATAWSLE